MNCSLLTHFSNHNVEMQFNALVYDAHVTTQYTSAIPQVNEVPQKMNDF